MEDINLEMGSSDAIFVYLFIHLQVDSFQYCSGKEGADFYGILFPVNLV